MVIMTVVDIISCFIMFSCWALAHGCYVVQVKARGSRTILELESLGDDVYICSCSTATAEV